MNTGRDAVLRWDWLRPAILVPYVPTIGPVHPDALGDQLFADVIAVAATGQFLDYDKDRRWFNTKSESILVDAIADRPDQTLVPTLSVRDAGKVSVYLYGSAVDGYGAAVDLAEELRASHRVDDGRVVWFVGPDEEAPPGAHITRVWLGQLGVDQSVGADREVRLLDQCPARVKATFSSFAEAVVDEGFGFLHDRVEAGGLGPVFVVVDDARVVGAIGPMEIMADSRGCPMLLPQYLGVLPEHRRRGHGRALWRSATHWGHGNGASYQLLQTAIGGASDYLCAAEGLRSLGFVCATYI